MNIERILITIIILISQTITGCSLSISNFSENISKAVKANNDTQTVMQALPAYLLLLDGLIESDPDDEDILLASSSLMNAYSSLLAADIEMMSAENTKNKNVFLENKMKTQRKVLANKSLERASKAICLYDENLCNITNITYSEFAEKIKKTSVDDISILYRLGTSWASWLQSNTGDWNAMAQLPNIKLIMKTVISYNENWDNAGAHMYLGVLNSLIPATLGGKPEVGKNHFESAIILTKGENQMAKVLYAEYYARLTFNEKLHNQLVSEVINYKKSPRQYILTNTIALQKAKALQSSSKDFF